MSEQLEFESLAYGERSDVLACTTIFSDVRTAMLDAANEVTSFNHYGERIWSGRTADEVREGMVDVPQVLRNFAAANGDVAQALQWFADRLDQYQNRYEFLQSQNATTADEIRSARVRHSAAIDRLRANPTSIEDIARGLFDPNSDPEVARVERELLDLDLQRDELRRRFQANDEDFDEWVASAVDLIRDADSILYNSGWDQFWNQTMSPILDTVRGIVEVLSIIVTVVVLITGVGALLVLALGLMLLTLSAADIIGTAASGRKVTMDQWLSLGLDVAAVVTLGTTSWAGGAKLASKASKAKAAKALRPTKTVAPKVEGISRMKHVDDARATKVAMAEGFEAVANVGAGTYMLAEGDIAGGIGTMVGGAAGFGSGRGISAGLRGVAGVAGPAVGMVGEVFGDSEATAAPKDWPGLDADVLEAGSEVDPT